MQTESHPLLIVNAVAGPDESSEQSVSVIQECLARHGLAPDLVYTTSERSARQIAREATAEGRELILVGGGDGTVSEVAAELVGKQVILGILPIGTFNNIARSLGILDDLSVACSIVAEANAQQIDVGVANDEHYFFEAAGIGLDATLFPIGEEIKGGRWSRVIEAARLTLIYRRLPIEITFPESVAKALSHERKRTVSRRTRMGNSIHRRALLTVIANGPYYGGGFTVAPTARLNDGRLTITIYRNFSKLELIRHFWSISRGRYVYSPKTEIFHSTEVRIDSVHALPVHLDGKPMGNTPVTLKALPRALRVLVGREPKRNEDSEPTVALPAEAASSETRAAQR